MPSVVHTVTVDCRDPFGLAQFWAQVFDTAIHPDDHPGDPEALVNIGQDSPGLLFIQVPEGKLAKNRLHIDLEPTQPREEEVARLIELGATQIDDCRRPDGSGWVVLADPEDNEFCVLMSAAERAALTT